MQETMEGVFGGIFGGIGIIAILTFVFTIGMFVFVFGVMFSPKMRSKFVGGQMKAQKQVLDDNEDIMEEVSTRSAKVRSGAIRETASAIREGLTGENSDSDDIYCKHCGKKIDKDSTFCKKCGKKQ